jgi:putative oxidoreductase
MATPTQIDSIGKLILRLTLGVLMLFHGTAKLMNAAATIERIGAQLASAGLPSFLVYGVFIGEVLAPLLLIFGVYARIGGLLVVINMSFAVFLVHANPILSLTKTGGWVLELQAFYFFTGLALLFLGSGKFAVKPD